MIYVYKYICIQIVYMIYVYKSRAEEIEINSVKIFI